MTPLLKNTLRQVLAQPLAARNRRRLRRGIASYGQEGEDRVLASLLFKFHGARLPDTGVYVDVGAHDPFRFSNTYHFYRLGWSGINIDAAPGSMVEFKTERPRDTNLEIGIGPESSTETFHVFNEPALNTFDADLAQQRCIAPWRIVDRVKVDVLPLRDVLARYLPGGSRIDFLTVDVEGWDLEVLRSNDWSKHRPMIVIAEIFGTSIAEAAGSTTTAFLVQQNYVFYAKTVNTAFFVDGALLTGDLAF